MVVIRWQVYEVFYPQQRCFDGQLTLWIHSRNAGCILPTDYNTSICTDTIYSRSKVMMMQIAASIEDEEGRWRNCPRLRERGRDVLDSFNAPNIDSRIKESPRKRSRWWRRQERRWGGGGGDKKSRAARFCNQLVVAWISGWVALEHSRWWEALNNRETAEAVNSLRLACGVKRTVPKMRDCVFRPRYLCTRGGGGTIAMTAANKLYTFPDLCL